MNERPSTPPATDARSAAPSKSRMLGELGESALLLPDLVQRALAANDRAKYLLTLLQAARDAALAPDSPPPVLRAEREAAGVTDSRLDDLPRQCRREADGSLHLPGAASLHQLLLDAVGEMLRPLAARGEGSDGRRRLELVVKSLDAPDGDRVSPGYIAAVTHARRTGEDGLHPLIMDLHKALNRVQSEMAVESLDGARVYGLGEADRPLVRAFMTGVNLTAPLKFEHPGLGTTATRAGDELLLQNDIGTTDAHLLVVRVRDRIVTVTYTDLHLRRATFFQQMLEPFAVTWEDLRSRPSAELAEGGSFHLSTGRFVAGDRPSLERYLAHLGSRLVFLIDWNRARKRLGLFVGKKDAIELLVWAAEHNYGHRAFLQLGGEGLIHEAIENARAPIRYGDRLDAVLGREAARDYLRFVLRTTSEGLQARRSERLIRDEIKAELLGHFSTVERGLMGLMADHAAWVGEMAQAVSEGLGRARSDGAAELLGRNARRAADWEKRADALLARGRELVRKSGSPPALERIFEKADDAADGLEDVAYLLSLLPSLGGPAGWPKSLDELVALVLEDAEEWVKCVESASQIRKGSAREDVQDFLEAVDRIVTLEHDTDDRERAANAELLREAADFRHLHLLTQTARGLERTADAFARAALLLRDHVLGEVMSGGGAA